MTYSKIYFVHMPFHGKSIEICVIIYILETKNNKITFPVFKFPAEMLLHRLPLLSMIPKLCILLAHKDDTNGSYLSTVEKFSASDMVHTSQGNKKTYLLDAWLKAHCLIGSQLIGNSFTFVCLIDEI